MSVLCLRLWFWTSFDNKLTLSLAFILTFTHREYKLIKTKYLLKERFTFGGVANTSMENLHSIPSFILEAFIMGQKERYLWVSTCLLHAQFAINMTDPLIHYASKRKTCINKHWHGCSYRVQAYSRHSHADTATDNNTRTVVVYAVAFLHFSNTNL